MSVFDLADNAAILADELRNALTDHENDLAVRHLDESYRTCRPFERQIEFGQRFLRIVKSAQNDRRFAAEELESETIESRFGNEGYRFEVEVPNRSFRRPVDIHWLLGVSGSGKTETLDRLQNIIRRDTDLHQQRVACPISLRCDNIANDEALFRQLLLGLEDVLQLTNIENAVWGKNTAKALLPDRIIKVCLGHKLSCLILDRVECLSNLPKPRQEKIINFLARLSSEAGVPILFVGYAAGWNLTFEHDVLAKAMIGRRPEFWAPCLHSADWCSFTNTLSEFHLGECVEYSEEVQASIYNHTRGILTFANVLFTRAAEINLSANSSEGLERDQTSHFLALFDEAAPKGLAGMQGILDALRSDDPALIRDFNQYSPLDMDFAALNANFQANLQKKMKEDDETPKVERPARTYAGASDEDVDRVENALFTVASAIGEEMGCQDEKVERYIQQSIDELVNLGQKVGPYTHPKAFLKFVLVKLEAERKERAAIYQYTKDAQRAHVPPKDLRRVLRVGNDVSKGLERAGYSSQPVFEKIKAGAGLSPKFL